MGWIQFPDKLFTRNDLKSVVAFLIKKTRV